MHEVLRVVRFFFFFSSDATPSSVPPNSYHSLSLPPPTHSTTMRVATLVCFMAALAAPALAGRVLLGEWWDWLGGGDVHAVIATRPCESWRIPEKGKRTRLADEQRLAFALPLTATDAPTPGARNGGAVVAVVARGRAGGTSHASSLASARAPADWPRSPPTLTHIKRRRRRGRPRLRARRQAGRRSHAHPQLQGRHLCGRRPHL